MFRSLVFKTVVLLVVFAAVPAVLYGQFREADDNQRELLLSSVHEQGRLVAQGLLPLLDRFSVGGIPAINDAVARFGGNQLRVKLLLRRRGDAGAASFFYIAAHPLVSGDYLERDRQELIDTGVLNSVRDSCQAGRAGTARYRNPLGEEEILSSITPIYLTDGCWVVITAHTSESFVGSSIARPYWQQPQVRIALTIYLVMALLVLSLFLGIVGELRRFAGLARHLRDAPHDGVTFVQLNRVPELRGIAAEFDRLVSVLRNTAEAIRHAAEENAHALKTPLAVIAQSLQVVRARIAPDDARSREAVDRIDRSVERLDGLVSVARRMDEAIAASLTPTHETVELSHLLDTMIATFEPAMRARGISLDPEIEPDLTVEGGEEMIETVMENLLENALGFSPQGGTISITARTDGNQVLLAIKDQGTGVPAAALEAIFDRYYSDRPKNASTGMHFGIGLWIVRRNVESVGGTVRAVNNDDGGLCVEVRLPRARS